MQEILVGWMENSSAPLWTAFILGLMTAISPCPLATNITAIGFISRDMSSRRRVFLHGMIYTLGRTVTYVGLAAIFLIGLDDVNIAGIFQRYGEKVLGPLLIVLGLLMLDLIPLRFPGFSGLTGRMQRKAGTSFWSSFLLGIVFAMAFCPYSGVLYFMMLIPLTLGPGGGLHLPVSFSVATGIPVIIFAWLIAFAVGEVGRFYNRLKVFELWFRRIISVLFILTGIYLILKTYTTLL
jgi:sulfite exporter TauE/SafE